MMEPKNPILWESAIQVSDVSESKILKEYARQVRKGFKIRRGQDELSHVALGLAGEVGEVANLVKKMQYEGQDEINKTKLFLELGDVLWYLQCLTSKYGWSIEQLAMGNIKKLEQRYGSKHYDMEAMWEAAV